MLLREGLKQKNTLDQSSAAPVQGSPGVPILVAHHLGPFAGGELLKDLMELEVVHIRGQVANKHRELWPVGQHNNDNYFYCYF